MNKMTVTHVIPAQAERFALYVMLHTNLLLLECYFLYATLCRVL